MKDWKDRNECSECSHFVEIKRECKMWDINRIVGDREPKKGKFNPIQHSCFCRVFPDGGLMKTSKAYYERFKAEFLKWQKELGLTQYRIDFFHEELTGIYAQIIIDELGKTARVTLGAELGKDDLKVDMGPERHARHEALHLLTNRLRWLGACRYIGDDELAEEWEAVVVRLEKVLEKRG